MSSLSLRVARPAMRVARLARAPLPTPSRTFTTFLTLARPPASASVGLRAPALRAPLRAGGRRFASTSASASASASAASSAESKSAYQKFKDLTKTYGSYAVIMYLALSAVDFALSFAVVHAVGAEHIEPGVHLLVRKYREIRHGVEGADALDAADEANKLAAAAEAAAQEAVNPGKVTPWYLNKTLWAEATLAYAIHKVGLLPIRAGLTVAWTPKVVNFLRARGWIGASGAKRAAQHGADKVREASQRAVTAAKGAVKSS